MIAGTGFRIDLARLPYLPEDLRTRIATLSGYPVLTPGGRIDGSRLVLRRGPGGLRPGSVDALYRRHAQSGPSSRPIGGPPRESERTAARCHLGRVIIALQSSDDAAVLKRRLDRQLKAAVPTS